MSRYDQDGNQISSAAPQINEKYDPFFNYDRDRFRSRTGPSSRGESTPYDDRYGLIRGFFKRHPERFSRLQRWLKQARIRTTYDQYLAQTARYTIGAGVLGAICGILITAVMSVTGTLSVVSLPVRIPWPDAVISFVVSNRIFVTGAVITTISILILSLSIWLARYYYPRVSADIRRRNINIFLPHAIVYMYAHSRGGVGAFEMFKATAETGEIYGEVSNELDLIVRDVEIFGNDVMTAIRNARDLTPSENLSQFLDDVLNVLDSGSDLSTSIERESNTYRLKAQEEQDDFLETLTLLSEIFIVAFVAAPLLLIITLLMISLLGGDTLLPAMVLIYLGLPLGMLGFVLLIKFLSHPYADPVAVISVPRNSIRNSDQDTRSIVARITTYRKQIRKQNIHDTLLNPLKWVKNQHPIRTLALTIPIAGIVVLGLLTIGVLPSTWTGMVESPIRATIGILVLPFFILGVPLSVLHEFQGRRRRRITSRFPDLLDLLSSMNQMDIRLSQALEIVSTETKGVLAAELRKVRNDIRWNHDVERALLSFANRLHIPQITRTMKLLSTGSYSSGDLSSVLKIAAEDTSNRFKIERERRREMSVYIVIVIIGFLVYVGVVIVVDQSYLSQASQLSSETSSEMMSGMSMDASIPVTTYRTLLFHSALIQGVGSGFLAGVLADGDMLTGLKYCLILVSVSLVGFTVI